MFPVGFLYLHISVATQIKSPVTHKPIATLTLEKDAFEVLQTNYRE